MSDGLARVPPPLVVVGHTAGLSAGAPPRKEQRPYASWGDPGTLLVVTYGSSRCPSCRYRWTSRARTPAVVAVPDELDESATVVVRVDDVVTELGPRPASHEQGG